MALRHPLLAYPLNLAICIPGDPTPQHILALDLALLRRSSQQRIPSSLNWGAAFLSLRNRTLTFYGRF